MKTQKNSKKNSKAASFAPSGELLSVRLSRAGDGFFVTETRVDDATGYARSWRWGAYGLDVAVDKFGQLAGRPLTDREYREVLSGDDAEQCF